MNDRDGAGWRNILCVPRQDELYLTHPLNQGAQPLACGLDLPFLLCHPGCGAPLGYVGSRPTTMALHTRSGLQGSLGQGQAGMWDPVPACGSWAGMAQCPSAQAWLGRGSNPA